MGGITQPAQPAPSSSAFDHVANLLALVADPAAHAARLDELRRAEAEAQARAGDIIAAAEQIKADAQADRDAAAATLAEATEARRKALALLQAAQGTASTSVYTEARE